MPPRQSLTSIDSTPSPKTRKAHQCKTCGSPMLGHKKGACQDSPSKPTSAETDLTETIRKLNLDDGETRRKSLSHLKKDPSLDSLSSSSSEVLNRLTTPHKNPPSINGEHSADAFDPSKFKASIMPGTLIKQESDSEDGPNPTLLSPTTSRISPPKEEKKKRKSVRVSLPGSSRTSLRIQRAQTLNPAEADACLRALFFKTTAQHATLFKMTSNDCEEMERAATQLGLQSHYYLRSEGTGSADADWLIIGKNAKAIDDMLETMQDEVKDSEDRPTGNVVTNYFLAQVAAAGLAGAAVMWAGLAFA